MIVTCERCATQFQLDDARVPENGVRVRCSRCKHAFQVLPAGPPPAASGGSEDEESDWEFNEDPRPDSDGSGEASGLDLAASVVDDLLGGASGPSGDADQFDPSGPPSGLELSGDPPAAPETPAPTPPPEPSASIAEASSADLSGAAPDEDPHAAAASSDPASDDSRGGDLDAPDDDLLGGLADDLSAELEQDLGAAPAPAAGDELSPGDWDLLTKDDTGSGSAAPRTLEVDPDELIDDRPVWQSGLERAGQVVGWLFVIALFAVGLHGGLVPEPAVSAAPEWESALDVELSELSGRFVEHAAAGSVYVVSGRVRNAGSAPVAAGTLAVAIVDREGRPLTSPAQVGPPLAPSTLREGEIAGPSRASPRLRAGETRPFEAVLGPLPTGAERVSLMVVPPVVAEPAASADAAAATPAVEDPEAPIAAERGSSAQAPAADASPPAAAAP